MKKMKKVLKVFAAIMVSGSVAIMVLGSIAMSSLALAAADGRDKALAPR